jgi:hypothetical protein
MRSLITTLQEQGQDFEFYPTTNEIIAKLVSDLRHQKHEFLGDEGMSSVLDIGAGSGKVLRALREATWTRWDGGEESPLFTSLYAIEKSPLLCDELDADIFIVGTEFHEQSLVSKQVDVTFCNPPYSEFVQWTAKIIRESASKLVYLVIPVRWQASEEIKAAVKFRDAETKVLGEYSFVSAEDRQARAQVHLIRIELNQRKDDAFDRFFDEQFGELKAKFGHKGKRTDEDDDEQVSEEENPRFRDLVVGPSYPDRMVELYNAEMDHVRKNYDLVTKLDADLLKEFDITPARILGCLKARMAGMRNTYWQELIGNMGQVTDRLCAKKREALLTRLNRSGAVDFTLGNIHAVILWVLKNANQYLDEQLIETFEAMVEKANVRNYKSNQRVFTFDRWRYAEENPTHIALEYRLVLSRCGGVGRGAFSSDKGLSERGAEFIGDLMTVARNLGFQPASPRPRKNDEWKVGETRTFDMVKKWEVGDKVPWTENSRRTIVDKVQLDDGSWQFCLGRDEWVHEKAMPGEPLMDVRAFYNSNMHVRLNQQFALALNVEYGRLKGWLKTGAEAAEELQDERAGEFFMSHVRLGVGSLLMLSIPKTKSDSNPLAEMITAAQRTAK